METYSSIFLGMIYCFKEFPTRAYMVVEGLDPKKIYWKCSGGGGEYGSIEDWMQEIFEGTILVLYDPQEREDIQF